MTKRTRVIINGVTKYFDSADEGRKYLQDRLAEDSELFFSIDSIEETPD